MHTYLLQVEPTIEVGRCEESTGKVIAWGNDALVICKAGHLIRGRILESKEAAQKYAVRLSIKMGAPFEIVERK